MGEALSARRQWGLAALAAYVACIVLANWAIQRFGFIPVGFGLVAPAGTYFAGAVFVARDGVQLAWGRWLVLPAIIAGAGLSWFTSPSLAVASGVAFLCGELSDWAFFTPLRAAGRFTLAFLLANSVGLLVDTWIFLYLAFGSLAHWQGTALGKLWMTLPACAAVWLLRRRLALRAAA